MKAARTLQTIPFLQPDECRAYAGRVFELQSHWQKRPWQPPYTRSSIYVLGTSTAHGGGQWTLKKYQALAQSSNPLLEENFQDLYEKLRLRLQTHLKAPTRFMKQAALPGFHMIPGKKVFAKPISRFHVDQQYQLRKSEIPGSSKTLEHLSITVPLCLPSHGGGLLFKEAHAFEIAGLSARKTQLLLAKRAAFHWSYKIGRIHLHSGLFCHQVAVPRILNPGDWRVTLQCHAVKARDTWEVYF